MRCANCDRQLATQADHDAIAEGDGEHLCWARYGSPCESIDWRARALEARAERDSIATQRDAWERDCAAIAAALGYLPGECAYAALGREVTEMRDALVIAQRERDEARAQLAALREAAARVMLVLNECSECPVCGNDGCSDVDEENNHVAGDACAALWGATGDTAAAAEAHDREVRARAWEAADALLDAEGPGRVYHERLLRARAAEERGR